MNKILIHCVLVLALTASLLVGFAGTSAVLADSSQQFDEQITSFIEEAQEASAVGEHKTLVLTLSEEDVAHKLAEMVAKKKGGIAVSVTGIQVHFAEASGHIQVTAKVKYFFFSTRVSADVLVTPEGRHGHYEVVNISMGKLPGFLVDLIMREIPYETSGPLPLGDLPVELRSITARDGKLYIKAITVPAQ